MNAGTRFSLGLLGRVTVVTLLLAANTTALASRADAAWATANGAAFQVGGKITEIVPTATGTFIDPTCGSQGGTSLALVRGSKLANVDPVLFPVVLVVSCLDNGGSATIRARLNFINPVNVTAPGGATTAAGAVVKQLTTTLNGTTFAPGSNGWAHLVHRPDKGDLLGCGSDGTLYSIDYSQTNAITDGAVTPLPQVGTSCAGLAWDADTDTIYQGLTVSGGNKVGRVVSFKDGTTTLLTDFTNLPCAANGLVLSGGVLLTSCSGSLTMQRLDKSDGTSLGNFPTVTATGLAALNNDPGLGDLACDPVTFQRDTSPTAINPLGQDLYRDTMWSRRGANGNGVAGVEFPAFTCGLNSDSVVKIGAVSFSPLAPGLSTGTAQSPGSAPLGSCFDGSGIVKDTDGDGLPDCWEQNAGGSTGVGGIDFAGKGAPDVTLCSQVNTNGDGTSLTPECADPNHKDLFAQIGWMDNHKPDPQALSQSAVSLAAGGVTSVREAFAAAPVFNPDNNATTTNGIRLHLQVDKQPVSFQTFTGAPSNHVSNVALTPCTAPASTAPSTADAADYDAIKATNFGRFDAGSLPSADAVRAMRLAWRYVLFAHNLVGANPTGGGSNSSGCSEVGGDDAVVALGSFATTTVNGISHPRGLTDQQAGTFMHEFGHLLGFQHGGEDTINNKPNYRSVMTYSRQFSGSPIIGRRLDYSRSEVNLTETTLNECTGVGTIASDPTLGPIGTSFPTNDQIAFGPGGWSVATPLTAVVSAPCTAGQLPINWDRLTKQGKTFQTGTTADISGDTSNGSLPGSNDWANVLYRFSAAIDFAGGRSETPFSPGTKTEMTKTDESDFFSRMDVDGNGVGDAQDCGAKVAGQTTAPVDSNSTTVSIGADPKVLGFASPAGTGFLGSSLDAFTYTGTSSTGFTGVNGIDASFGGGTTVLAQFLCPAHACEINPDGSFFVCPHTHRIDVKPSAPLPKVINLGTEANVTVAIFSEPNWDASKQIKVDAATLQNFPLTFTVETVKKDVKTNNNGSGTCSISDVADPFTGLKTDAKDLKCQFPTSGLPIGTHWGVVRGWFLDPATNLFTAFSARQEVTILP